MLDRAALHALLRRCPLIASVQSSPGSAVEHPETLCRLAQASIAEGVQILRLQGLDNIRTIKAATNLPVIGLLKVDYPDSPVYITPTVREVDTLIELGCEIIALDATQRPRPHGENLADLVSRIHTAGRLAMADCDSEAGALAAAELGFDIVSTTLSGYTSESMTAIGPDLDLVRNLAQKLEVPVIAEGRYAEPWQLQAAVCAGASAVVIGGALNDPVKQTRAFLAATPRRGEPVMAVDIGGTWIRAAFFSPDFSLMEQDRSPLPQSREERRDWIVERAQRWGQRRISISSGGTIDPATTEVIEAKPIIPDHVGTNFREDLGGFEVSAINDGLATAWGQACRPEFAGKRVATLALGTGVGFGIVDRGRILKGPQGEYPRINDVPTADGRSFEDLLGGAGLSPNPSEEQMRDALVAGRAAVELVKSLYYPDVIVVGGGVGLSKWFDLGLPPAAWGPDAGLYGAAAVALFPPTG